MKRIFGILVAAMIVGSASAYASATDSVVCRLSGTVIGRPECDKVAILECGGDPRINDLIVVPVADGKFSYTLRGDVPRAYSLFFPEDMYRGSYRDHPFITGNGEVEFICYDREHEDDSRVISNLPENMLADKFENLFKERYGAQIDVISAKTDSLFACNATYSPEYLSLLDQRKQLTAGAERDSIDRLITKFNRGPEEKRFSPIYMETLRETREILGKRDSICRHIITEYPSVFGLRKIKETLLYKNPGIDKYAYIQIFDSVYREAMAGYPYIDDISRMIDAGKVVEGNKYPDYKITRPDGSTEMIATLIDGNVAVIDLWASWCGPCRRHSMELVPLYEKYKDRGFKVIAVARENGNCNAMNKAMKSDGYPWESFVDLNDADKVWSRNAAGNSGGKIILVGADGIIVAIDPAAEDVKAYLERVYGE